MAPTTPSCDKPTDLTKLFHDALQNTPGAQLNSTTSNLNQSFDESKKSSFFSGFKWNGALGSKLERKSKRLIDFMEVFQINKR